MTPAAQSPPTAQNITTSPRLSIIIPTLDEEHSVATLLNDLEGLGVDHEVIVVDGGSIDRTRAVAQQRGAKVIMTRAGRGYQLAAGAAIARGRILCFLHADVRLPGRTRQSLADEAETMTSGAAVFTLTINAEGRRFRLIERMANWRTRVLGLPYGDQGLLVARADYDAVGGYQDIKLMEDVAIVRALRRHSIVRLLDEKLLVSARRWRRDGVWRRTLGNWTLVTLYMMGFSPNVLARLYRTSETSGRRLTR
ncbi:MAG TPA: TIGR04283 family arsenosugar biosynthesis glycosyltransferase [Gemmatimonadaceae bacterium]|nr:TIGR04283 family arsenosugar biosynthesis glycosyltransferase [Gemmatimonadaceae bacterium]